MREHKKVGRVFIESYMDLIPFLREFKLHDYGTMIQWLTTSKGRF